VKVKRGGAAAAALPIHLCRCAPLSVGAKALGGEGWRPTTARARVRRQGRRVQEACMDRGALRRGEGASFYSISKRAARCLLKDLCS
jgi:hypothetical protein